MFKTLLSIGVVLLIALTLYSCGETTVSADEKEIVYPFKIGDKVCVMETFNGVVVNILEFNGTHYYVDYITKCGTKTERYHDFQLTLGSCEPVELGGVISEDTDIEEDVEDENNPF